MKNLKRIIATLGVTVLTVGCLCSCKVGEADISNTQLKDLDVDKYVTLGDYKNLTVEVDPLEEVSDEEIDYYVNMYLQYYGSGVDSTEYEKDGAVEEGDTVNIDYAGAMEDIEDDGLSGTGYDLTIGSGSFIDGFEEGLIGHVKGDVVELPLTFPDNYWNEEMAGKAVTFTVTINYIVSDAYNDAKAASIGIDGVTTVSELRTYVEDSMNESNQSTYDTNLSNAISNALVASCIYEELPDTLVTRYEDFIKKNIEAEAAYNSMSSGDYVSQYYNSDIDTLASEYGADTLREYLATQAVANIENLNVTDEELEAQLTENATAAGYDNVDDYIGDFDKENFRDSMMYDKVIDFIKNNTNLVVNTTESASEE